jgi:Domain of unknown function (DUF4124)
LGLAFSVSFEDGGNWLPKRRISMIKIAKIAILILFLFLPSISGAAEIYKWLDKDGSVNFTDDLSKVPPEYRDQVKTEEVRDSQKTQTPTPGPASVQKTKEEKRDALGRGEEYWRETVRPWKKQLKQAQEDYNNTNIKIDDALETLKGRYYSHTQYNFKRVEVEGLMAERGTYEAKMKEANTMLTKIRKEAEEANADPAWLE